MSRMNRRRFTWVATSGVASAALVACGGDAVDENLSPTQIPDAEGAPPTLAPQATPFSSEDAAGDGGEGAADEVVASDGQGGAQAIELEAQDPFNWSMYEFEAAPGQDIHIVNTGALQHNFVVDEWGVESNMLNGGEEDTVTVPGDAEVGSEVVYYCAVPGHREGGMEGTITVVEAGAASGAAEEEGGEEEAAAGGTGEAITVEALDTLEFTPSEFEAAPGQDIHVVNAGSLQHDFVVDEIDLASELLDGGEEQTITVPEDAEPGDYTFYCSVPGHREGGMEGTITIVEGGGGAAEEEAPAEEEGGEEEAAAAGGAGEAITVEALDSLEFTPSEFEVAPGQEIHVVNVGSLQHDFVVEDFDLATELLNGGEEQTITVPEDMEPGDYVFFCSVPGHRAGGMEGTMTVTDGGGSAASGASEESDETAAASDEAVAASSGGEVTVEALDSLQFEPAELSAAPGQSIRVINHGTLQHDFVVDEWGWRPRCSIAMRKRSSPCPRARRLARQSPSTAPFQATRQLAWKAA